MTVTATIDMTVEHRRVTVDILRRHLPADATAWVFGSRATGRARRYSDLDLAIDACRPLSFDETGALREAFEESDLPYRIDIVDWQNIGERFRRAIASERIALIEPRGG